MDLNAKTEPKSKSAHDEGADVHGDAHADAKGIEEAIIVNLIS